MTTFAVVSHIVTNRVVWTYQADNWPLGVITGYENEHGFFIEHVIVFPHVPRGTLLRMLRAGMAEAWDRGYCAIRFCLPEEFPLTFQLTSLARRLGFEPYIETMGMTFYIRWRP